MLRPVSANAAQTKMIKGKLKELIRTVSSALFILLVPAYVYASKPTIGIFVTESKSPRIIRLAGLCADSLARAMDSADIFSPANSLKLRSELARLGCLDEACIIRYARTAGLNLLVYARITERGAQGRIEISCFAMDPPYYGRMIHRYTAMFPLWLWELGGEESINFCDEQAAYFCAGMLRGYRRPVPLRAGERGDIRAETPVVGRFEVYRFERNISDEGKILSHRSIGHALFRGGQMIGGDDSRAVADGDFILVDYREEARRIRQEADERKRRLSADPSADHNLLYAALLGVPASIAMPLISPLAYYSYGDFEGLALWAVSASPYLALEVSGLVDRPQRYREKHRDVSRDTEARYHFALYMLVLGGLPLTIDAISHHHITAASQYRGRQAFIGSGMTAAFLSITTAGGGHFYRGYRVWGYVYFHLDTALVYLAMRSLSRPRYYNELTARYERGRIQEKAGYAFLGALGAAKLAELVHVLVLRDRIRSGDPVEESFALYPYLYHDGNEMAAGLCGEYKF